MAQEQSPETEQAAVEIPSLDYSIVDPANRGDVEAFESTIHRNPGQAAELLSITSRLLEGSAYYDVGFDKDSEAAIADSGELPVIDRSGTPEAQARRTVALFLKRGALFAGRLAAFNSLSQSDEEVSEDSAASAA